MHFETSNQTPNQLTSSNTVTLNIREGWGSFALRKVKRNQSGRPLDILERAQALAEGPWARAAS